MKAALITVFAIFLHIFEIFLLIHQSSISFTVLLLVYMMALKCSIFTFSLSGK